MDIKKLGEAITEARDSYLRKNFQGPQTIRLRKDVAQALHASSLAFNFDFADLRGNSERYMGMDVVIVDEGPEFEIPEVVEDE